MERLLGVLISVTISGSVLTFIIMLLSPLLKKKVSKAFAYYIWALALLRFILPFGFDITIPGLSPFDRMSEINKSVIASPIPDTTVFDSNQQYTVDIQDNRINVLRNTDDGNTLDYNDNGNTGYTREEDNGRNPAYKWEEDNSRNSAYKWKKEDSRNSGWSEDSVQQDDSGRGDISIPAGTMLHIVNENAQPGTPSWHFILALIWLAGVVISLCWNITAYSIFIHKMKKTFTPPSEADQAVFMELCHKCKVRMVISSQTEVPMFVGVFRPVIILPATSYVENGMERELRGILHHELTHYIRRDTVFKWSAVFVTSLHWFNPFVYLMRREIGRTCELACDEAVIRKLSEAERMEYGNILLALASKQKVPIRSMSTTMCESKKQL